MIDRDTRNIIRPSSNIAFQSNIMQTKLIKKKLNLLVKQHMKPFVELNWSRHFIHLEQTDKTSEMHVSSDVVVQTH